MTSKRSFSILSIFYLWALVWIAAACSNQESTLAPGLTQTASPDLSAGEAEPTAGEALPDLTPTPLSPSATAEPLAARVNGEGIPLAVYEAELTRVQAYSGTGLATYETEEVLDELIDQVLLAQAAGEAGYLVDDERLETRIQELGLSDQALVEWMQANGYTQEGFRQTMKLAIAAAWMRDQIIIEVPTSAEQVHARQILLYNSTEAEAAYAQLEAGTDFGTLAAEYDPITSGELGWFPRGYLNVTELDEVLFSLEPGAYSVVIRTSLGYHLVQVLEREDSHPLTADARRVLQVQKLAQWLETRRNRSEILILLP
ncbi:MAG: peptidylprolyl isomerase [Anaerolineales bacterium]|nr:peptidylprolyl isomerase [Anaerolineales bacterium]